MNENKKYLNFFLKKSPKNLNFSFSVNLKKNIILIVYFNFKMKKITLRSGNLQNNFRLFRVKVAPEKIQEIKDMIMEKMNEYLEDNDGFVL